jgi:hypothetical protein
MYGMGMGGGGIFCILSVSVEQVKGEPFFIDEMNGFILVRCVNL